MKPYAIIIGDLVKSRKIINTDIVKVINSLKQTFDEINQKLLNNKGSFEIFRGDSFQCLVPEPEKALLVAIIIRAHLRTYKPTLFTDHNTTRKPILYAYIDARIAAGIGAITYKENKLAESHGEAFERSGYAFDVLKKGNDRLAIITPWSEINKELHTESKLADAIISRWTASTAEAMYYHLLFGYSQEEIASHLSITQPGVHKRITLYGNADSIKTFLDRYEELILRENT